MGAPMKETIHAVIVDDEEKSVKALNNLLEKYVQHVNVDGVANCVKDAVSLIDDIKPELVFLDINMPDGIGFDVLEQVSFKDFEVIFVTAYESYALKAFEFSAIHYLLKPINYLELQKAISRFESIKVDSPFEDQISVFRETFNDKPSKIILPTSDGLNMVDIDTIIRCEADSNYTLFFLADGSREIVSKSLNNFDKLLADLNFIRVHNKHLINLRHVKKYIKGKTGYVIMNDEEHVYVSDSKRKTFLESLKNYAKSL
ncbi:MAG: DNA-binding response regulator [Marinilabiliales bacterium]|nr:MAG: DNA-binding response regulator [Marinilabiliales bacterium]